MRNEETCLKNTDPDTTAIVKREQLTVHYLSSVSVCNVIGGSKEDGSGCQGVQTPHWILKFSFYLHAKKGCQTSVRKLALYLKSLEPAPKKNSLIHPLKVPVNWWGCNKGSFLSDVSAIGRGTRKIVQLSKRHVIWKKQCCVSFSKKRNLSFHFFFQNQTSCLVLMNDLTGKICVTALNVIFHFKKRNYKQSCRVCWQL